MSTFLGTQQIPRLVEFKCWQDLDWDCITQGLRFKGLSTVMAATSQILVQAFFKAYQGRYQELLTYSLTIWGRLQTSKWCSIL